MLARTLLAIVRVLRATVFLVAAGVERTAVFAGIVISRGLLLPVYRIVTTIQLRLDRLASPARSFIVSFLTHRYLFHATIALIAVLTIASNLTIRQARAQDVGESSILYDLVADQSNRASVEDARQSLLVRDSKYTGESSLVAAANIDFDYEDMEGADVIPSAFPDALAPLYVPSETAETTPAPDAKRTETVNYIVKDGDTLAAIANRFGVTVGTVLWANGRTATQYIRPGDTLRIPPVSGVLVTVKKGDTLNALATTYGAEVSEVVDVNRLDSEKPLPIGAELILPGGEPPTPVPVARPPQYAQRPTTNSREPAPTVTTKPPDADTTNTPVSKLRWPTSGHVITQYYGWRHTGLDIDGDLTSPLYAAHDGTVTTAGWNSGGYGLQIVITGDGVMTRYAHNSKNFVKVGDKVKKGQTIAMMGSTGRSTGSHIHFEVYINGVRQNPLKYIK